MSTGSVRIVNDIAGNARTPGAHATGLAASRNIQGIEAVAERRRAGRDRGGVQLRAQIELSVLGEGGAAIGGQDPVDQYIVEASASQPHFQ